MNRAILQLLAICVLALTPAAADVCDPNPCRHGGSCVHKPMRNGYNWGYECTCQSGYFGAQCQWDNANCTADTTTPCVNGGQCVDMRDGRFCSCPGETDTSISYGGHYCEIVGPCKSCPSNTVYCQQATYRVEGRLCLDERHREIV